METWEDWQRARSHRGNGGSSRAADCSLDAARGTLNKQSKCCLHACEGIGIWVWAKLRFNFAALIDMRSASKHCKQPPRKTVYYIALNCSVVESDTCLWVNAFYFRHQINAGVCTNTLIPHQKTRRIFNMTPRNEGCFRQLITPT